MEEGCIWQAFDLHSSGQAKHGLKVGKRPGVLSSGLSWEASDFSHRAMFVHERQRSLIGLLGHQNVSNMHCRIQKRIPSSITGHETCT